MDQPNQDDLIRLIQTVENVNQQLLFENKFLKEEITNSKANMLNLINENTSLHRELKNVTVLEILNEVNQPPQTFQAGDQNLETKLRTKEYVVFFYVYSKF